MNETFWGILETQISAMKNCESASENNLIILETAKYLIEQIDLSDTTIAEYDKFGIRKVFAAHNSLGEAIVSFYDKERSQLDPVAQNGAIGQKLAALETQIRSTAVQLQQMEQSEQELFAKETELRELEKKLEGMKHKVEELQKIETDAENEIHRYEEQFVQLEEIIRSHKPDIEFWTAHLGENSTILQAMSDYNIQSLSSLLSEIDRLKTNIQSELGALDEIIARVVSEGNESRMAVLKKQNKLV